MTTVRTRITAQEVAADPTNAFEVTVNGDVAIESLTIHGTPGSEWTSTRYANGGTSAGTPVHWHSYVRITECSAPNCEQHGKSPCMGVGCDGMDADDRIAASDPDAYWVVIVDRSTGATRSVLCVGENAADHAHARASAETSVTTFAAVVGRR
jgi:hypothetical protein